MKTINSLSGGKTSSYIAMNYPADIEIFSLVRIEDKKCAPKSEWLIKKVEDKIGMEFIATAEDDKTLIVMFDLEQKIGREIIWVTGDTFDEVIRKRKALPNMAWRFCTTEMKMKPIFEWWQKNINEIVEMRVGYRYDEMERKNTFTTSFKTIVGRSKNDKRNKWGDIEWRTGSFPLIDDKINHFDIISFWKHSNSVSNKIEFPPDSNCVGCFWKNVQQLRKNWEENPAKMHWFANQETPKIRWKKETHYDNIC